MATIMYEKRDITVGSQGRNGYAQTHGIAITLWDRSGNLDLVPKFCLYPITSKGDWQNCSIDIPVADFWRMVEELEKEGLRP